MKRIKIPDIVLHGIKVILALLILLLLVFFSYRLVEGRLEDLANADNPHYRGGLGLYIFASHIVLFGANIILTALGGICWLIAKKYKSSPLQRQHVSAFRWLTLAPLVSQLLYVLVNVLVMSII